MSGFDIQVRYNGHVIHTYYINVYVDNQLVAQMSAKTEAGAYKLKDKLLAKIIVENVRENRKFKKTLNKLLGIETETGFCGTGTD